MDEIANPTLQRIRDAALDEFLAKGFRGASLRNIVKTAGVTTGAFYGYYGSKEELFDALVRPHADHLMGLYDASMEEFWAMSPEYQETHVGEVGSRCMHDMMVYCYEHRRECQLLFKGAEGTKHENFMHEFVEKEIRSTHEFEEKLSGRGYEIAGMSESFEHIITSGMFAALVEPLVHEMPLDEAIENARMVHEFYTAGWMHIMGLHKGKEE